MGVCNLSYDLKDFRYCRSIK